MTSRKLRLMANLASLPTELLAGVTYHLCAEDFLPLRETCRAIADRTFWQFQCCYFTTRVVLFERQSLQNLVQISRHPVLREAVKNVEVCVHHLNEPGPWLAWIGDNDAEKSYKEIWKDMADPASRMTNIIRLAEALSQFPNCTTVGVGNRSQPWGAIRLARRIGVLSRPGRPVLQQEVSHERTQSKMHASFCIQAMVSAICLKRTAVKEMYIAIGTPPWDSGCAIPLMLVLPPYLERAAKQHLTTITTLSMLLRPNMEDDDMRQSRELHSNDLAPQRPRSWHADLQDFLDVFTSLSNFSISVARPEGYDLPTSLYSHMRVRHLQVLNLIDFECTADQLLLMLRRHKSTLSKLALHHLNLLDGDLALWTSVIQALCDDLHLEELRLSRCGGVFPDSWKFDVPDMYICDGDPDENSNTMTEAVVAWKKELAESYERQQAELASSDTDSADIDSS